MCRWGNVPLLKEHVTWNSSHARDFEWSNANAQLVTWIYRLFPWTTVASLLSTWTWFIRYLPGVCRWECLIMGWRERKWGKAHDWCDRGHGMCASAASGPCWPGCARCRESLHPDPSPTSEQRGRISTTQTRAATTPRTSWRSGPFSRTISRSPQCYVHRRTIWRGKAKYMYVVVTQGTMVSTLQEAKFSECWYQASVTHVSGREIFSVLSRKESDIAPVL